MRKYCMKCMRRITSGDICPQCGPVQPQRKLPHILPPGTVLKERYLVGNTLGQGGFGITYIGCDLLLDMRVAIKEYYPAGYANRNVFSSTEVTVSNPQHSEFIDAGLDKFLREARVLAEFHDAEGIVDVRDFFRENNTAYIVMEYLDGITMQECIQEKLIEPKLMVNLMTPVLDSLERIHAKQVIHRDISPDNIMLMRSGKLKLMDFGAARQVDFSNQKSMSVVLKTGYAPVEQYRPKGELGPWTDIYALCATMYVCITGMHPDNALERVFSDTLKWPREIGIPMTESMENVLKKGMAVPWKERYQSIAELREALLQAMEATEEPSISAPSDGLPKPVERNHAALTQMVSTVLQNKDDEVSFPADAPVTNGGSDGYAKTIAVIDDSGSFKEKADPTPQQKKQRVKKEKKVFPAKELPVSRPKKEKAEKLPDKQPAEAEKSVLHTVPKRVKIIAVSAAALLLLVIVVVAATAGGTKKVPQMPIDTPAYLVLMSDAKDILAEDGVQGQLELTVETDNYNEKYKTYTATCQVTVNGTDSYTINLKYNYSDEEWILNSGLSGVAH